MLKIYINKANESWVVDRFRKEFISHNPQITTKLPYRSNVVWIISPWTWRKLSIKTLNNSKVICTIHHLENKDIEGNNLEDFLEPRKYFPQLRNHVGLWTPYNYDVTHGMLATLQVQSYS